MTDPSDERQGTWPAPAASSPLATLLATPIPPRLQGRPRDPRGFPVPVMTQQDAQGNYDFRVTEMREWVRVVQEHRCGLCGQKNGYWLYFIGGPKCQASRTFFEPPMHEECARYALAACPFLAIERTRYARWSRDRMQRGDYAANPGLDLNKPPWVGLFQTRTFKPIRNRDSYLLKTAPFTRTELFAWGEGGVGLVPLTAVDGTGHNPVTVDPHTLMDDD